MYLVLRPPWGGGAAPTVDAAVAFAPVDAGSAKPKQKPKRKHPVGGGGVQSAGDDEPLEPAIVLTAADRALEWRGDNVVPPPQRIDMSAGADARPLEDSEINATVGNQTGGIRDCVVHAATGADLQATITIKLIVDGSGHVTKSKLQAPHYLFEKGLLACAQRELGRMRFPASGAPTLVTFPVNLG